MHKLVLSLIGSAAAAMLMTSTARAECGDVNMAEFNWASGQLLANVDKFILEKGYGCNVELTVGGTTQIFTSMNEKGRPEIAGELWVNAVRGLLDAGVAEGRLHSLQDGPITGLGEGWWVTPKFRKEHPELDTVEKLIEHPELFPYAEDKSKGAFIGCPAGWGCQLVNANLYRAFDMEAKGWTLVDPGSGAGLDGSLSKAAERGENWFGYYWNPTALIGKYDMQLLPFEAEFAGKDNWDNCIAKSEQDCADPKKTAWTNSEVHTVVTDAFKKKSSVAAEYMSKRVFPGAVMNGMLVYMADEQASGEDAAIEFLEKNKDLWKSWVPADVATKVEAAL